MGSQLACCNSSDQVQITDVQTTFSKSDYEKIKAQYLFIINEDE